MVKEISNIVGAEARIHAHICGDGCLSKYFCKRSPADLLQHKRRNPYRLVYSIKYCNTDDTLLGLFSRDIKQVYGVNTSFSNFELHLKGKWIYERLKAFGAGKSREWFIADEIFNQDKNIISEWLKAFFDDEAHVDVKSRYIALNSVNLNGLKQVQELLARFGIRNTTIKGPYVYKKYFSYRLKILRRGLQKFSENVGFNHPKKIIALQKLLSINSKN